MNTNQLFFFFSFLFLIVFNVQIKAQQVTINGRITTFNDYGLNQVAVTAKGAGTTAVSDSEGYYSITCLAEDKLTFKANGFIKEKINLKKMHFDDSLNVNMEIENSNKSLELATGYGHIGKDKLTHAIERAETTNDYSEYASVVDIIKGRVSGVQVAGNSVVMRGPDTYNDQEPLIVVDGTVVDFISLNNIPTSQVKSIDVLKGASASSLYGSRGMQGVIVIRTKMKN